MNPSLPSESTVTNCLCDVMAHSLHSSPNSQNDKINDKKRNEWVIHFAGIKENENATQEFDQKTSIKGTLHEIQAYRL